MSTSSGNDEDASDLGAAQILLGLYGLGRGGRGYAVEDWGLMRGRGLVLIGGGLEGSGSEEIVLIDNTRRRKKKRRRRRMA